MKRYDIEDYEEYKKIQIERSTDKWGAATFNRKMFFKILLTTIPKMWVTYTGKCLRPERICCMGIRNGNEYKAFRDARMLFSEIGQAKIYGVDINPEVEKVGDNCFAYDFNHLPVDWENKFDLIYSNSIDHAFKIKETLAEWWRLLQHNRFMLLTMASGGKIFKTDIYDFTEADCEELFDKNKFEVRNVWQEYGQKNEFNVLLRIKK